MNIGKNELRDFHAFLGGKLKNGGATRSPEAALEEWREQQAKPGEFPDDSEAIQEALDDMANGDHGRPYEEVMAELRRRIERKTKNR